MKCSSYILAGAAFWPKSLAMMLLCTALIQAQDDWHFEDKSELQLPDIITMGMAVEGGDVNADGSVDLLIGCVQDFWPYGPGYEQLLFNDGSGYFSLAGEGQFPQFDDLTDDVLLFDCDGDQDLDAYVINFNWEPDYLAINDGSGNFSIDWTRMPQESITGIVANYADIDGDGNIDMVRLGNALNEENVHRVWMNDGNGYYENQSYRLPALELIYSTVEFADVDGDLDLDLLVNDRWDPGRPRILINDGAGFFADESDNRFPPTEWSRCSLFSDIDNDGDFDVLMAYDGRCGFFINDGSGFFAEESAIRGPQLPIWYAPSKIKTADLDNDGDEDIILGANQRDYILVNVGNGFYEDLTAEKLPAEHGSSTEDLQLADFDEDGDIDFFRVGGGLARNSIYINTSNVADSVAPEIKNQSIYPNYVTEPGPYPIRVIATDGVSMENKQIMVSVYYSIDSMDYSEINLTYVGGSIFYGRIPAVDSGTVVRYFYSVADKEGNLIRLPENAPDSVLSFTYLPEYTGINQGENGKLISDGLKLKAYPNPFNSSLSIVAEFPEPGSVQIYDILGRVVCEFGYDKGLNVINWGARDKSGAPLATGVYFIKANIGVHSSYVRRVIFLK